MNKDDEEIHQENNIPFTYEYPVNNDLNLYNQNIQKPLKEMSLLELDQLEYDLTWILYTHKSKEQEQINLYSYLIEIYFLRDFGQNEKEYDSFFLLFQLVKQLKEHQTFSLKENNKECKNNKIDKFEDMIMLINNNINKFIIPNDIKEEFLKDISNNNNKQNIFAKLQNLNYEEATDYVVEYFNQRITEPIDDLVPWDIIVLHQTFQTKIHFFKPFTINLHKDAKTEDLIAIINSFIKLKKNWNISMSLVNKKHQNEIFQLINAYKQQSKSYQIEYIQKDQLDSSDSNDHYLILELNATENFFLNLQSSNKCYNCKKVLLKANIVFCDQCDYVRFISYLIL